MEQFTYVVLGCIFSKWREFASTIELAFSWLLDIHALIERSTVNTISSSRPYSFSSLWFKHLCDAAQRFKDYDEVDQRAARQLIALGRRKAKYIYPSRDLVFPLFGLTKLSTLVSMMRSDNTRVAFLRKLALQYDIANTSYIIRYRPDTSYNETTVYEYASVCPIDACSTSKRTRNGQFKPKSSAATKYVRWLSVCFSELTEASYSKFGSCSSNECHAQRTSYEQGEVAGMPCKDPSHSPFWPRHRFIESTGEKCLPVLDVVHRPHIGNGLRFPQGTDCNGALRELKEPSDRSSASFAYLKLVAGDAETAAIFRLNMVRIPDQLSAEFNELQPRHMEGVLTPDVIAPQRVIEAFFGNSQVGSEFWGLKAYGAVMQIYKLLPDATASISVIKQPLTESKWFPKAPIREPAPSLSLAQVFSCICMFDSGTCDLDPSVLGEVFAMSSGNSIYVAGALLCDPYEEPSTTEVRRVIGNVGRAGISLLIVPPDLNIREAELEHYKQINHMPFEGHPQDSFRPTSVHLSFTEYAMPLVIQNEKRHIIDRPANLVETLIQVYDQRAWVADLDIIKAVSHRTGQLEQNNSFQRLICHCEESSRPRNQSAFADLVRRLQGFRDWQSETIMTNIDNWDKMLDPPQSGICVVRAQGNWLARLAISAMCSQLGFHIIVMPQNPCWTCCEGVILSHLKAFSLSTQEPRMTLIW